jgi:ABC-2 type transport system permease protein
MLIFLMVLHGVAFLVLRSVTGAVPSNVNAFVVVTAVIVLSGSAMLAQAVESVTRIFYTRSDLELLLTAPVDPGKLFAVRIAAMALTATFMSLLVLGPFINVLAFKSGGHWLAAYGVLIAVSVFTTALAVSLTFLLFKLVGPVRTRVMAQIAAAVIGGLFVIGLQLAALISSGTLSRFAVLTSPSIASHVPGMESVFWYPARAAMGDGLCLALVLGASIVFFLVITERYAPQFADHALIASSRSQTPQRRRSGVREFRVEPASSALRLKERRLLLRDPWLISQSLMQLLYLIPPGVLLSGSVGGGSAAAIVLVPVLIMAAGQLAGGLAWLTISGEDAPDLVLSAPIANRRLFRAKVEVVLQSVGVVLLPFATVLAWMSPREALLVVIGGAAAAASATTIQLWFKSQSKRSHFRRRHTSSRIATLAEALISITWAAAGAAAAISLWVTAAAGVFALGLLACVRAVSPRRTA